MANQYVAPPDVGVTDVVQTDPFCRFCVADQTLGSPSYARWVGPDGLEYCSMHFIQAFGHNEKLVRIEDYVPPTELKPPAP